MQEGRDKNIRIDKFCKKNSKKKSTSYEVDIWSAGCVLAEMYTRRNLFPAGSDISLLNNQVKLTGTPKTTPIEFMKLLPDYPGEMEVFGKYGEDM